MDPLIALGLVKGLTDLVAAISEAVATSDELTDGEKANLVQTSRRSRDEANDRFEAMLARRRAQG